MKGETREATVASQRRRRASRPPPLLGFVHEYVPDVRCIHSFRPSSRNSRTCSARWESDRRNSAGCFFRFPFPSLPSPSLSRSIWEYGPRACIRQNPENSRCISSREGEREQLVTNLSLRHWRDNGISVVAASRPGGNARVDYSWRLRCEFVFFHKRPAYESPREYSCSTRIASRQNGENWCETKAEGGGEIARAEYLIENRIISKVRQTFMRFHYGIWKVASLLNKISMSTVAFDTINGAMSKWPWSLAIVPLYAFRNGWNSRASEWLDERKVLSRFSRIELLSASWYKSGLSYDSVQTARNKATLATLVRLGDAKSDTRARITMLPEYIHSITRA